MEKQSKELLEKQGYRLVGEHSAVKLCTWLRKSIAGKGHCYKQKFYGIESHRCLQMTPTVSWCTHRCMFCWRNTETTMTEFNGVWEEPKDIIDKAIESQRGLISGCGGLKDEGRKKYLEARNPRNAAISLAGEPSMYPLLSALLREYHRRDFTTFLVTNGTLPERLTGLDELPTQLYVSLVAPNKEIYKKTCIPLINDGWDKLNETLSLFPNLDTRKVIRMTLVKGWNMMGVKEYAKMIEKASPDYIEAKAFMLVGGSRNRLTLDNMPSHEEVKWFAEEIAKETGYSVKDEKRESRVVLLSR